MHMFSKVDRVPLEQNYVKWLAATVHFFRQTVAIYFTIPISCACNFSLFAMISLNF